MTSAVARRVRDVRITPDNAATRKGQLIARMGTIRYGNSLLAEGIATPFSGPLAQTIPNGAQYSFSLFPSFNSTPSAVPATAPGIAFNAAGSFEKLTAPTLPPLRSTVRCDHPSWTIPPTANPVSLGWLKWLVRWTY
jgi:hypothetical protein